MYDDKGIKERFDKKEHDDNINKEIRDKVARGQLGVDHSKKSGKEPTKGFLSSDYEYVNPLADGGRDLFDITHSDELQGEDPPDVKLFKNAQQECLDIFMQRKREHGNHLNKTLLYHLFELFGKCERYCEAISSNKQPSDDLLIDISNYSDMIRSHRHNGPFTESYIFKTENEVSVREISLIKNPDNSGESITVEKVDPNDF